MKMAYILIVAGLVCIVAGVYFLCANHKDNESVSEAVVHTKEKVEETIEQSEEKSDTSDEQDNKDNRAKGIEFEKYVVSRFSRKYFSLKEWRGDKHSNGIYAESSTYPDMEFTFTLRDKTYAFAVECKWRAKFNTQNKLRWSYTEQLNRYRQFAEERNIPVFVIIGIGGTSAEPAEIYVVPLASIESVELSKKLLENYRHDLSKTFFFDIPTQTLR